MVQLYSFIPLEQYCSTVVQTDCDIEADYYSSTVVHKVTSKVVQ